MYDFSNLSDEDLERVANGQNPINAEPVYAENTVQTNPAQNAANGASGNARGARFDFSNLSDEDLARVANGLNPLNAPPVFASPSASPEQPAPSAPHGMDAQTASAHAKAVAEREAEQATIAAENAENAKRQDAWTIEQGKLREGDTWGKAFFRTLAQSIFTPEGRQDSLDVTRNKVRDGGAVTKAAGFLSDLTNSLMGLVGGAGTIVEGAGTVANTATGYDGLRKGAKAFKRGIDRYFPTDMTDTAQKYDENGKPIERGWGTRIADEAKNVVRVAAEFAPAAVIPGYGNALVAAGGINRTKEIYDTTMANAEKNGFSRKQAIGLAAAAGTIDVASNLYLMGKFLGKKEAQITEKFFQSYIKRTLMGTPKTAGIMGASGGAQAALQTMAETGEFDLPAIGNAIVDGVTQGAMFHVLNGALHGPIEWSKYKGYKAAQARAEDAARAEVERAAGAEQIEQERAAYNAEQARAEADALRVATARRAMEDPQNIIAFMRQNPELTLDVVAARRRGEDVPAELWDAYVAKMGETQDGKPISEGITRLMEAFQTQGDLNVWADRLLQYYDDANVARRQRESRLQGEAVENGQDLETRQKQWDKEAIAAHEAQERELLEKGDLLYRGQDNSRQTQDKIDAGNAGNKRNEEFALHPYDSMDEFIKAHNDAVVNEDPELYHIWLGRHKGYGDDAQSRDLYRQELDKGLAKFINEYAPWRNHEGTPEERDENIRRFREKLQAKNELGKAERKMNAANRAEHDRRGDEIARAFDEADERNAELTAMRAANEGRGSKQELKDYEKREVSRDQENAEIERLNAERAEANDDLDVAEAEAYGNDALSRFKEAHGIKPYEEWLGGKKDSTAMRWMYGKQLDKAIRRAVNAGDPLGNKVRAEMMRNAVQGELALEMPTKPKKVEAAAEPAKPVEPVEPVKVEPVRPDTAQERPVDAPVVKTVNEPTETPQARGGAKNEPVAGPAQETPAKSAFTRMVDAIRAGDAKRGREAEAVFREEMKDGKFPSDAEMDAATNGLGDPVKKQLRDLVAWYKDNAQGTGESTPEARKVGIDWLAAAKPDETGMDAQEAQRKGLFGGVKTAENPTAVEPVVPVTSNRKVGKQFKASSERLSADGDVTEYKRYGTVFAERQPVSVDGKKVGMVEHYVDGRLRELVGESSDVNEYVLFFDGSRFGSHRAVEDLVGTRPEYGEGAYSVLTFKTEKEMLNAYDKLNSVHPEAFDTNAKWEDAKPSPSGVEPVRVKREFYDAARGYGKNGSKEYDIKKGLPILNKLSSEELDDIAWFYHIDKNGKSKKESPFGVAVMKAIAMKRKPVAAKKGTEEQESLSAPAPSADQREAAYQNWLANQKSKNGKPKKDTKAMRMMFDKAVKDGKVDAGTGDGVSKTDPDVPKTAPVVPKAEEPVKTDDTIRKLIDEAKSVGLPDDYANGTKVYDAGPKYSGGKLISPTDKSTHEERIRWNIAHEDLIQQELRTPSKRTGVKVFSTDGKTTSEKTFDTLAEAVNYADGDKNAIHIYDYTNGKTYDRFGRDWAANGEKIDRKAVNEELMRLAKQKQGAKKSPLPSKKPVETATAKDVKTQDGRFPIHGTNKTATTKEAADAVSSAQKAYDEAKAKYESAKAYYVDYLKTVKRGKVPMSVIEKEANAKREMNIAKRRLDDALSAINDKPHEPSEELFAEKSRIDAMPETDKRTRDAKKRAQKNWLLKAIDEAIAKRGDSGEDLPGERRKLQDENDKLEGKKYASHTRLKNSERISEINKLMAEHERIVFDVPDDGKFFIYNSPYALKLFKSQVQKRLAPSTLKETTIKAAEKPLVQDIRDGGAGDGSANDGAKPEVKNAAAEAAPTSAPSTDLKSLGAKAEQASRTLGNYASSPSDSLAKYAKMWRKRGSDKDMAMADAADTVIAYREAAQKLPQNEGGAKFTGDTRDARGETVGETVGEANEADKNLLTEMTDRLAKLVPGVKAEVAPATDEMKANGASARFNRKTGEVRIDPNAPLSDAVHEIGGHAVRLWAEKNCPELLRKAVDYALNAPKDIKDFVFKHYGDFNGDALLDEVFAHRFVKEHGKLFRQMLNEKPAAKHWWTNITNAVRSVFQDVAKKNGVDTEKLKGLGAEDYVKGVAEQMALGKTLNEWTAYGKDKGYFAKGVEIGAGDGVRNARRADAKPYDERTSDGRKYNEKYAGVRIGDTAVSRRAVDALGEGGRELDAALAARRADAGEAPRGVLRYSRGELRNVADVDENIRQHEKMRFGDGETRKRGMETLAVVRDGDSVYKYRNAQTGLENERTKVARHNELFGDKTPYEIVDFASDKDGDILVVRQPHVDLMAKSGNMARKQLEADLRNRFGKVEVSEDGTEMRAGDWIVDDLKDANVGIDKKTGRYAVVDALIHRAEDFGGKVPKMDGADGARGDAVVMDAKVRDGDADVKAIRPQETRAAGDDAVYGDDGIRYSRTRHPVPTGTSAAKQYMDKDATRKEKAKNVWEANLHDRYNPIRDVITDALMSDGRTKADALHYAVNNENSPYHAQRVRMGMAEKDMMGLRALRDGLSRGLKGRLNRLGLDIDDVGAWAYASHAEARNDQKLRDHGVMNGSGLDQSEINKILNGTDEVEIFGKKRRYTPEQRRALEDARTAIVRVGNQKYGLDYLHKAGLIDAASQGRLHNAYGDDHVILADQLTEDGVDYAGPSTSVANPLKKAHGRTTKLEDNPLVSSVVGWSSNIVNAQKNMAAEKLARFVEAHPEMGEVRVMTPNDKVDASRIVFRRNNMVDDGAGGTVEKNQKMLITLYGKRGTEIARSFTDAGVNRSPSAAQAAMRWYASFATQLSPTFTVGNFLKDTVEVAQDTLATQGLGATACFLRKQMSTFPLWNREFRQTIREWRRTGDVTGTSELATQFKEFVESGALIGGMAREGYADNLESFKEAGRGLTGVKGKFKAIGNAWKWYVDKVGTMNETIEMLTRFNNYRARRTGKDGQWGTNGAESIGEAAINSREGSTDFNMYGNQRWLNDVYMFSNSILGGTARAVKSLTYGKYGRRVMAGLVAMGFLEEMANQLVNGDDADAEKNGDPTEKDVTEYDRENSLRIRVGGKLVKLPMHFGPFSLFKYVGNNAYRAINGDISNEEAVQNVAKAAFKIGTHLTGTGEHGIGKDEPSPFASLTPTVAQPAVQIATNKDYKGDPIHREHNLGAAKHRPDYLYAKPKTHWAWVQMSRLLNNMPLNNGSDLEKGNYSLAPEDFQYLAKQVFKNFGTDVVNTFLDVPTAAYKTWETGENQFELDNIPLARRTLKDAADVSQRYYDASAQHAREQQAFNLAKGEEKRAYLAKHPAAPLKLDKIEKRIKLMQSLARGEIVNKDGKVVGTRDISQKMKEQYEAQARKLMAHYLKLLKR